MKLIINATNMQIGGGLQVSYSLITEFKQFPENEYHVFLSPQLEKLIDQQEYSPNFYFYSFSTNPTSSVKNALTFGKKLSKLEQKINPDFVFTPFGPALWVPKKPHMIGFANVILFDQAPYTKRIWLKDNKTKVRYFINRSLILRQLKKEGDIFWVETELAKRKIQQTLHIADQDIHVISNNYGLQFEEYTPSQQPQKNSSFRFLYISSYYPHKNLEVLNAIIPLLKERGVNCTFHLTLKQDEFERIFPTLYTDNMLHNLGPLKPKECPPAYDQVDALFFPTFLEFFTAAYPEAMKMGKPIITSDLDFAHDICAGAALYFDPFSPASIVATIEQLINNPALQQQLVAHGKERLSHFDTARQRAEKILKIMQDALSQ